MELNPPPARRPAELFLRAHRAHATHHELLAGAQLDQLGEVAASVASAPPGEVAPTRKPRRRRST